MKKGNMKKTRGPMMSWFCKLWIVAHESEAEKAGTGVAQSSESHPVQNK